MLTDISHLRVLSVQPHSIRMYAVSALTYDFGFIVCDLTYISNCFIIRYNNICLHPAAFFCKEEFFPAH